jgi:colanic acid/amylovoran biosynthesis glycosyltransferase
MNNRIGYLIPEFPGQTHIFFWRELQALMELGLDTDVVSTHRPPKQISSHQWAAEAEQKTFYLMPFSGSDLVHALLEVFKAGLVAWLKCLDVIANAKDVSLWQKLRLLAMVPIAGKLVWLAKQRGWSHIHVHSCANAANVALLAALISELSYSLTLHGPLADYGENQQQKWSFAKFCIVITQKLYEEVKYQLAGYIPSSLLIAPMGVDTTVFNRQTPYQSWVEGRPCQIFSCGRLNPCKGHANLIQAVAILKQQGVNIQLEIAGEDEQGGRGYRKELENLIQQLDLSSAVHLLGAVSETTVKDGLENAHVFVLASLSEPLGVAFMEAMAMGTPIVGTSAGGVKELVEDGVDGILVEPGNVQDLATAISKVIKNPELATQLSQRSRHKISTKFHHRRSAEVLANALQSATA